MTFQQLRYLLEVHKTGSISKAAENLFVSRPSVSLSISSQEAELGYPLFIRSQNGLIPSPQGRTVIKYANNICQTHEMIKNINTKEQTTIRLSVIKYAPVDKAIIRLLNEYKDRHDISFSITTPHISIFKKIPTFWFFSLFRNFCYVHFARKSPLLQSILLANTGS